MDEHSKPANPDDTEFLILERAPRHRLLKLSCELWRRIHSGRATEKDVDQLSRINEALDLHFPNAKNVTLR
ncbi:MAG: hypothetical protein ACOYUZ_01395 [Patescibacteria group bacterium]